MQNLTPSSALAAFDPRQRRRVAAAAVLGNAIEFYDFVVYAFFAVYLSRVFFPSEDPRAGLLLTLAVFGVGFVARPIGAVAMGVYADRKGRRSALILTMTLITVATMLLALLPSYAQIGIAAPLMLVLCRLAQGFAFGGEVGPATAYLMEVAPPGRRGLYCSWMFASQGAAACLAGLIGSVASATLTQVEMEAWGWRLPFAVSVLLAPLAFYLRRQMRETLPVPRPAIDNIEINGSGSRFGRITLLSIALLSGTVTNYVCGYLPTYAVSTLQMPMSLAFSTSVVVGVGTLIFGVLGGWLGDRFGRRPVLLWSRIGCTLLALPLFWVLSDLRTPTALWAAAAVLAAINGVNGGALFAAIPEAFNARHRASGMALVYASGVALFGGSTQFVVAWLIGRTGSPLAPAWYVVAMGCVAILALSRLPHPRNTRV